MQKITKKFLSGFIYLALLFCISPVSISPAFAAGGNVLTTADGIKYITGGIGEEEAAAMRGMAKDFTLNLVFSERGGGKITGINAVIFNDQGQRVFYIKDAKPLVYVNLPAGKYRVLATYEGEKQGFVVTLENGVNKKLILNWKSGEYEDTSAE